MGECFTCLETNKEVVIQREIKNNNEVTEVGM